MGNKSLLGVVIMAWCVTASGSFIRAEGSVIESDDRWQVPSSVSAAAEPTVASSIVDARTGLSITVEEHGAGGVRVKASGHGLEVEKSVDRDGSFTLTIRGEGDSLAVSGSRAGIVVTRGSESARITVPDSDPAAFGRAAALLSGSPALRLFRAAVSRLGPAAKGSAGGLALEIGDLLLRVVQDDPGAVGRFREARTPVVQGVMRVALLSRPCYADWEREVLGAWDSYESCYNDFSWWSGGREVCAMLYVLRVEAAWFEFLTCAGLPFK